MALLPQTRNNKSQDFFFLNKLIDMPLVHKKIIYFFIFMGDEPASVLRKDKVYILNIAKDGPTERGIRFNKQITTFTFFTAT